jgi:hypothetical protein
MSMSKPELQEVTEFLEDNPNYKIKKSPYRETTLRIVCDDMILLIHDAEVIDLDDYIEEVQEYRKQAADFRIASRVRKVKALLKGPQVTLIPGVKYR